MAGEVLHMNIIAKFELWCFVSSVVLKSPHYAKPRTVTSNAIATVQNINESAKTTDKNANASQN